MLRKLSLIFAIVAGLAVAGINFFMVAEKMKAVEANRAREEAAKKEAQDKLAKTTKDLEKTTADLTQTKETLATTTPERDTARKEADAKSKKASELTEKLAGVTRQRDDALSDLGAYKATQRTPQEILNFDKTIKGLQDSLEAAKTNNVHLTRKLAKVQNELNKLTQDEDTYRPPALPVECAGKVLVSDPKWDFVVLNVGADQGALEDSELLVNRHGKLVAKLRIHSVQKERCIANVIPGWKLADVEEGDQVIPAS